MYVQTYHPSPQNALERPQSPSLEQHAPHVGVHTQLSGVPGPQVPSSVVTPVCQAGGGSPVVVVWATAAEAERRRARRRAGVFMLGGMGLAGTSGNEVGV